MTIPETLKKRLKNMLLIKNYNSKQSHLKKNLKSLNSFSIY